MARLDVNRSGEMEVFVSVVELGGFSAAARRFSMTPSAVSKLVSRLESRLGARLINRSTRKLQLTAEGCRYYEQGIGVLASLSEAENAAARSDTPQGRIKVAVNVPFATHVLLPLVPEFVTRFPGVNLDLSISDHVVDMLEERADVAVRAGPLKSSGLVARKLGRVKMHIAAAPSYLEKRGAPLHPHDLADHALLAPNYVRAVGGWPFNIGGHLETLTPNGPVQASDGEALRLLALQGVGLARLADFQMRDDIRCERLCPVLEAFTVEDFEDVHAVFLGHGGYLPARVRVFLDFLVEHVRL